MPVRAIAFDFNGTLSDDEPVLCEIFVELFAEHGKPLSAQEYFDHLAGHSDPEIVHRWLGSGHADEQAVIEERIRRYRARVSDGHTIHEPVREAVRYAAERVPVAIVSGAMRAEIEPVVESAGLAPLLRGIVGADDVVHGKPDPEGYLKALPLLGAEPADVLVLRGHGGGDRLGDRGRDARDREAGNPRPAPAGRRGGDRRRDRRRADAPLPRLARRPARAPSASYGV